MAHHKIAIINITIPKTAKVMRLLSLFSAHPLESLTKKIVTTKNMQIPDIIKRIVAITIHEIRRSKHPQHDLTIGSPNILLKNSLLVNFRKIC